MLGYSIVNQKGQVTVPVHIRKDMGLEPDDIVIVSKVDGGILIKQSPSISALRGSVKPVNTPEDFKAMRKEFEKYMSNRKNV